MSSTWTRRSRSALSRVLRRAASSRSWAASGIELSWWVSVSILESSSWTSSSLSWTNGSAFRTVSCWSVAQARKVHGSVLRRADAHLHRIAQCARRRTSRSRSTGSQVLSAAQCATSTSAGALAVLAQLGGRVVAQVGGQVDVDARRACPVEQEVAGPAAQRRPISTSWSGSPATRTPCAVSASTSATWAANSRRVIGDGQPADPPGAAVRFVEGGQLDHVVRRLLVGCAPASPPRQPRRADAAGRPSRCAPPRRPRRDRPRRWSGWHPRAAGSVPPPAR